MRWQGSNPVITEDSNFVKKLWLIDVNVCLHCDCATDHCVLNARNEWNGSHEYLKRIAQTRLGLFFSNIIHQG